MSAQNKPSPTSDETCSPSGSDPLSFLAHVPYPEAFDFIKKLETIAIDVWGHSLWKTEGTTKFFHWAWTNPLKVEQSVSTVQLVADYLHDQHPIYDMYEDEYDIDDALVMCNYVLHYKKELKSKCLLATVYKVKITALKNQLSYKEAVEAVTDAAAQDCLAAVSDVLETLHSCLRENGLHKLAHTVTFYRNPTPENKKLYDNYLIEQSSGCIERLTSDPLFLLFCHSEASNGKYFGLPDGWCVATYGDYGTLSGSGQAAQLLWGVQDTGMLPMSLEGDVNTHDEKTDERVKVPDARFRMLNQGNICQEKPIEFRTEQEDLCLKQAFAARGWQNWQGIYHYDPNTKRLVYLTKFATDFQINNGARMTTSQVLHWLIDHGFEASTLVIQGCNVVHTLTTDLRMYGKQNGSSCMSDNRPCKKKKG